MDDAIDYPIENTPAAGSLCEVAPGVYWARMPLPIPGLEFINLWLLEDGEGWTLVDTGVDTPEVRAHWERIFAEALGGRPITRLICTHFHVDHMGLAGWLMQRWQAPLWMTAAEWSFGRMLTLEAGPEVPEEVIGFYRRAGLPDETLDRFRIRGFNSFTAMMSPLPRAYHRVIDGDVIRIGRHDWRVIVGRGHSPEHAALYCADLRVLISGDQVLPRITPHIGVSPGEPDGNPLALYLASLEAYRGLPADTFVLPSHNRPFIGLHRRLDEIARHHEQRLDTLMTACAEPAGVLELLPVLFRRTIDDGNLFLAVGEALAHLHVLTGKRRLARIEDDGGVFRFRLGAAAADAA